MEKEFKILSLETKNINPSLEEVAKFSGGVVNEKDSQLLINTDVAQGKDFQPGEKVVVLYGDTKNIPGTVHSVENDIVTVITDKEYGLDNYIQYSASDLAKRFSEGDHAQVINGVHKDETGLVLKIENNLVTLLSDSSLKTV